jgi:hypothetical protein
MPMFYSVYILEHLVKYIALNKLISYFNGLKKWNIILCYE